MQQDKVNRWDRSHDRDYFRHKFSHSAIDLELGRCRADGLAIRSFLILMWLAASDIDSGLESCCVACEGGGMQ